PSLGRLGRQLARGAGAARRTERRDAGERRRRECGRRGRVIPGLSLSRVEPVETPPTGVPCAACLTPRTHRTRPSRMARCKTSTTPRSRPTPTRAEHRRIPIPTRPCTTGEPLTIQGAEPTPG